MAHTCNSLPTSPFACLMSSPVCAVAEMILKHTTSATAANLLILLSNGLIVGRERNFSVVQRLSSGFVTLAGSNLERIIVVSLIAAVADSCLRGGSHWSVGTLLLFR